jgi:hypothetical protein
MITLVEIEKENISKKMSDYYYSSSDEYGEVPDNLEKERKLIRENKVYQRAYNKRDFNTVTKGLIDGKFFIDTKPHIYAWKGYPDVKILRDTKTREELVHFNITEYDLQSIHWNNFLRIHK